eukprot:4632991-Prymnesium_polylepis.1
MRAVRYGPLDGTSCPPLAGGLFAFSSRASDCKSVALSSSAPGSNRSYGFTVTRAFFQPRGRLPPSPFYRIRPGMLFMGLDRRPGVSGSCQTHPIGAPMHNYQDYHIHSIGFLARRHTRCMCARTAERAETSGTWKQTAPQQNTRVAHGARARMRAVQADPTRHGKMKMTGHATDNRQ